MVTSYKTVFTKTILRQILITYPTLLSRAIILWLINKVNYSGLSKNQFRSNVELIPYFPSSVQICMQEFFRSRNPFLTFNPKHRCDALQISPSGIPRIWPIFVHLNLLISTSIFLLLVRFNRSFVNMMFGWQIHKIRPRHSWSNACSLSMLARVIPQVVEPFKSIDLTPLSKRHSSVL